MCLISLLRFFFCVRFCCASCIAIAVPLVSPSSGECFWEKNLQGLKAGLGSQSSAEPLGFFCVRVLQQGFLLRKKFRRTLLQNAKGSAEFWGGLGTQAHLVRTDFLPPNFGSLESSDTVFCICDIVHNYFSYHWSAQHTTLCSFSAMIGLAVVCWCCVSSVRQNSHTTMVFAIEFWLWL